MTSSESATSTAAVQHLHAAAVDCIPAKKQCKMGDMECTMKKANGAYKPSSFLAPTTPKYFTLHNTQAASGTDTATQSGSMPSFVTHSHSQPSSRISPSKDMLLPPSSATAMRASSPLQTLCSMACQERVISAPLQLPYTVNNQVLYQPAVKRESSNMSDSVSDNSMATVPSTAYTVTPSSITARLPSSASSVCTMSQATITSADTLGGGDKQMDRSAEKKLKHIQTDRDRRARIKQSLHQLRILLGMSNDNNAEQSTILASSVGLITQLQHENQCLQARLHGHINGQHALPVAASSVSPHSSTPASPQPMTAIPVNASGSATDTCMASSNDGELMQLREHVKTLQSRLDRELKANSLLSLERRELQNRLDQAINVNNQLHVEMIKQQNMMHLHQQYGQAVQPAMQQPSPSSDGPSHSAQSTPHSLAKMPLLRITSANDTDVKAANT